MRLPTKQPSVEELINENAALKAENESLKEQLKTLSEKVATAMRKSVKKKAKK